LVAISDLPTPPLPEKTRITSAGPLLRGIAGASGCAGAVLARNVPFFCSSWYTRRIAATSSSWLNGLMRNSRAPACMALRR
jgi:hypothetical protein